MRRSGLIALVVATALLTAACGDDSTSDSGSVATTSPSSTTAAGAATVELGETSLGMVLTDGQGRTLYLFAKDADGKSNCEGGCAELWPPLAAGGDLSAGAGLDRTKLGTITRADGTAQVTYAGAPLYRYSKDASAGDVNGQNVGSVWFVVGADGKALLATPTTEA